MQPHVIRVLVAGEGGERIAPCLGVLAEMGWQAMLVDAPDIDAVGDELLSGDHDVAIISSFDGLTVEAVLDRLPSPEDRCPVIVIPATRAAVVLADCLKRGAWDCPAPEEPDRLLSSIRNAVTHSLATRRNRVVQSRLAERENLLRTITAHIPGMVFRLRVSDTDTRFAYVSEGAESLLQASLYEIIDRKDFFFSLVVEEDRHALRRQLGNSLSEGAALDWTGRLEIGGEITWINLKGSVDHRGDRAVIDGVAINVTESREGEQRLLSTMVELETLTKRLQEVREEERQRITREMHDELGSLLTAVKLQLFSLGRWAERSLPGAETADVLTRQLETLGDQMQSAIETVRRIARELRPKILDDLGVAVAIEWYVSEFARSVGLKAEVQVERSIPSLDERLETAIFRIVQESLTNVARHAGATEVQVALHRHRGELELAVHDDGVGVGEEVLSSPESTGLVGIRERARRLGGRLELGPSASDGTLLQVFLPTSD